MCLDPFLSLQVRFTRSSHCLATQKADWQLLSLKDIGSLMCTNTRQGDNGLGILRYQRLHSICTGYLYSKLCCGLCRGGLLMRGLQIIDMGLEEKSAAVLGAALVWQDGQNQLFILVPDQLLVYTIKA